MSDYLELTQAVLEEHRQVLLAVSEDETGKFLDAIAEANCIQVFGMGRMKCAVRAFVMRLMHMGLDAQPGDQLEPLVRHAISKLVSRPRNRGGLTRLILNEGTAHRKIVVVVGVNLSEGDASKSRVHKAHRRGGSFTCVIPSFESQH